MTASTAIDRLFVSRELATMRLLDFFSLSSDGRWIFIGPHAEKLDIWMIETDSCLAAPLATLMLVRSPTPPLTPCP